MQRESLLKPLQLVAGVVERRQTKPILSHLLLTIEDKLLTFIGTDMEIELHGFLHLEQTIKHPTQITLPGKKFLDICRSLPEEGIVELTEDNGRITVSCDRSRFVMSSLPAKEFPRAPEQKPVMHFEVKQNALRKLIGKTSFSIPQQDVRQYLNGLLFVIKDGAIQTLATDGHRLAVHSVPAPIVDSSFAQVIIPRKGVVELLRLLEDSEEEVAVSFNSNLIQIKGKDFAFISKLISGKFPNYNKIIPKKGEKKVTINCAELKSALIRVGILSNELFRSVHFRLRSNLLVLAANNPDQEEAVEELSIDYKEENIDTIFNIGYLLDILNSIETETINIFFNKGDAGVVIEDANSEPNCLYVLMPIRQ